MKLILLKEKQMNSLCTMHYHHKDLVKLKNRAERYKSCKYTLLV